MDPSSGVVNDTPSGDLDVEFNINTGHLLIIFIALYLNYRIFFETII